MYIVRYIIVILCVLSVPNLALADDESQAQYDIPDLLADEYDEFEEDEYLEDEDEFHISDPLEPVNRVFFEFNDTLYEWVLKPVTDGYIWLIPRELRECAGNFFYNLAAPVRLLNSIIQGEVEQTGVVLKRFIINSTLGVYGLVDIAYIEFDIEAERADFGQTLGRWGFGSGIYLCLPVIGPSSVRGTIGLVVDAYTHPIPYFHDDTVLDIAYYTSNRINTLSLNPDLFEDLKRYSLDPYIASRQVYYEYRKALVESDSMF